MKTLSLLPLCLFISLHLMAAEPFTAQGTNVAVAVSAVKIGDRQVDVKEAASLPVAAAPVLSVANEPLVLSADKPVGWAKGTRLKACNARDVNASGSFVPGSLEIRLKPQGEVLKEGEDYLVDAEWGHVGLGPKSHVSPQDTVYASYRYSLRRMDTVQVSAQGIATLKTGEPHISSPVPPEADAGQTAVAHVFVDHRAAEVNADHLYPITEQASQARTASTTGRIPRTLAKLKAGQPVTIVCLGDSVTAGGNASKPELRYVDVFATGLQSRFPKARIDVQNLSAGGSNSRQWLDPERYAYRGLHGAENPARFDRVVAAKPDLVTIEFVNDAGLSPVQVEEGYEEILKRLGPGTEVILITPHFTMWKMMGFSGMREVEKRPYVLALREFANRHQIGLADASARWEHLWKEGLPYLTLLNNTINHPDDRGHRLFAEELWKCFE
ncbi:MAG: Lipolytic protein family [Verrucomicrobiaceae bacterium]|nr:Lipolytic protein family [Verrucomicrobiaceae bacterium]